jgi:hypothetical protein
MQTTATGQGSKQATDADVPRETNSCINKTRIYPPVELESSSQEFAEGLRIYVRVDGKELLLATVGEDL